MPLVRCSKCLRRHQVSVVDRAIQENANHFFFFFFDFLTITMSGFPLLVGWRRYCMRNLLSLLEPPRVERTTKARTRPRTYSTRQRRAFLIEPRQLFDNCAAWRSGRLKIWRVRSIYSPVFSGAQRLLFDLLLATTIAFIGRGQRREAEVGIRDSDSARQKGRDNLCI